MADVHVIEAGAELSRLIDRVLAGEQIVVARDGQPAVRLEPIQQQVQQQDRSRTEEMLRWLDANRVRTDMPSTDAGTLLSQIRDEDWR